MLTRRSIDVLTRRALARLALALTAYRVKNGHYPATMEELMPAYLPLVPVDPLAGQPLRMHRAGSWLMLADARGSEPVEGGPAAKEETQRHGAVFWLEDAPKK